MSKSDKVFRIVMISLWIIILLLGMTALGMWISCIHSCNESCNEQKNGYLKNGILAHDEYMSGDYVYKKRRYNDEIVVHIIDLSPEGETREVLMIPQMIDGYPVKSVGKKGNIRENQSWFGSETIKKVYIPTAITLQSNQMDIFLDAFRGCVSLEKIYYVYDSFGLNATDEEIYGEIRIVDDSIEYPYIESNIIYHNNYELPEYETSEYRFLPFFVVDEGDYGSTITPLLRDPIREGYSFGGWYKEPECINAWNYATDTLPEIRYEDGYKIVKRTILYAKWIENE